MFEFHGIAIEGAIFDMDGTMFDTERLRFQTLKQASQELIGQEFSDDYLMSCLGLSAKRAQELAEHIYGTEVNYALIRKRADQLELEFVRQYGVPMKSGLIEVLERLRKTGLRMAVATSSKRVIAEEYLINANVYKYFDVVVCGDDVEKGKPDPEIFLLAVSKLSLVPNQCLMFEDSDNGLKSAHLSGGHTILLQDLKKPTNDMLHMTAFFYVDMQLFLQDLNLYTETFAIPVPLERFPQAYNQHIVGIHGFGAIGGGYLAQIFAHWDGYTRPQKIIATTSNVLYKEAISAFGKYCIRYHQESYDEIIDGIEIVDAEDDENIINMYKKSTVIGLCLPEHAIERVSKVIAKSLIQRYEQHAEALTLIIILNKIGAKEFVIHKIKQALLSQVDMEIATKIIEKNYFVDTVVNRMVSKLTEKDLYRQLRIKYHLFKQYQEESVDDDSFDLEDSTTLTTVQEQFMNSSIAELKQNFQPSHVLQSMDLILFHSESDMPLYAEDNSPIIKQLRQITTVSDICQIQIVKNRLWNGIHSIIAWYGILLGHETIGIAMGDYRINKLVNQLLNHEVGFGLLKEFSNLSTVLPQLKQSFLSSCQNAFKDPCIRVARHPMRKLQLNDRVFGSIQMNIKHDIPCDGLLYGVVLGLLYAEKNIDPDDENAHSLRQNLMNHVSISKILEHNRSDLKIQELIYDEFIDKIDDLYQLAKEDIENFLKDWSHLTC